MRVMPHSKDGGRAGEAAVSLIDMRGVVKSLGGMGPPTAWGSFREFFLMARDFDLLGDPIPDGFGKRGRPPHVPNDEKRKLVMMLQALDWGQPEIADALGITEPTLKKHYFRELRTRTSARRKVEAVALLSLLNQVEAGNVGAIKALDKKFEAHDLSKLAEAIKNRGRPQPEQSEPKKGKKELQQEAASAVSGKYAPPVAPSKFN